MSAYKFKTDLGNRVTEREGERTKREREGERTKERERDYKIWDAFHYTMRVLLEERKKGEIKTEIFVR